MSDTDARYSRPSMFLSLAVVGLLFFSVTPLGAQEAADEAGTSLLLETPIQDARGYEFAPVRTDSPRQTLTTFLRLRDETEQIILALAREGNSRELHDRTLLIAEQARTLLDLSSVPSGSRREIGGPTTVFLLDILGRVELPDLDTIPDVDDEELPSTWRIPGTPIRIVRMEDDSRVGQFLFSAQTIRDAPRFYQGIKNLPLRTSLPIESWTQMFPQLTGPLIPASVPLGMPDSLRVPWLDTPIWKILAVLLLVAFATFFIVVLHRATGRIDSKNQANRVARRALTPLAILVIVSLIEPVIAFEINVFGVFRRITGAVAMAAMYAASTWLFWLVVVAFIERLSLIRGIERDSFDAQFLLVGGKSIGFVGSVIIVGAGAQALGLPIYSIVAGMGVGGLAVALAIRPTLENLIAGVILYLDQPVRVGDFCSFGGTIGTVESIGIRSTKLRALDRTLVTVPNAALADMHLINWAMCDQMLIKSTIGLRYETDPDQLRYVLVKFREMLHSHPKIGGETVRVRFTGYGSSSLDIGIRVYALTRDWNEFHAIREDIFLRIHDIVRKSGSDFAFPAQTLYMARDSGLDKERGEVAKNEVQAWRNSGKLPFPRFSTDRVKELEGTLDWPPRGSVNIGAAREVEAEPLSAESEDADTDQSKH